MGLVLFCWKVNKINPGRRGIDYFLRVQTSFYEKVNTLSYHTKALVEHNKQLQLGELKLQLGFSQSPLTSGQWW